MQTCFFHCPRAAPVPNRLGVVLGNCQVVSSQNTGCPEGSCGWEQGRTRYGSKSWSFIFLYYCFSRSTTQPPHIHWRTGSNEMTTNKNVGDQQTLKHDVENDNISGREQDAQQEEEREKEKQLVWVDFASCLECCTLRGRGRKWNHEMVNTINIWYRAKRSVPKLSKYDASLRLWLMTYYTYVRTLQRGMRKICEWQ